MKERFESPRHWLFEIQVSSGYIFGGGPDEPFEKVLTRVAPKVDGQRTEVDGRHFAISQDPRMRGEKSKAGFTILTADPACIFDDVIDDVITAGETIIDSITVMSSSACRVTAIVGWLVDPWPKGDQDVEFLMVPPNTLPRYRSTATTVTLREPPAFAIPPSLSALPDKVRAALRWYAKSMEATSDVDQFAFLWIAAEIVSPLVRPDLEKTPIRVSCGHFISECPECARSVMKVPQGEIMRAILSDSGVEESSVRKLWRTRQMFHGANHLTNRSIKKLPEQISILRAAVQKILMDLFAAEFGPSRSLTPAANLFGNVAPIAVMKVPVERVRLWEELGLRG